MPKRRVAVFIDYQNCYHAAREAFHAAGDPMTGGQFWPKTFANLLASKGSGAVDLTYVGVYCGIADPRREPKTAAARQKQIAAWQKAGVNVVTRPLRYGNWPREPAEEKGIDVKLAIDVVMGAVQGFYDVGIIGSCDTDLGPVVEALLELKATRGTPDVEVLAWKDRQNKIGVAGAALVYRWVGDLDYAAMRDFTDYNL